HRVIDGFMIQGGDPLGNGTGGPGYQFEDEIPKVPIHPFTKPGLLAMANAGPNTNGSQFFITVDKFSGDQLQRMNAGYTVFGEVVEGMDVVYAIAKVKTNISNNKPLEDVVIKSVKIVNE